MDKSDGEQKDSRETWSGRLDFLMGCLSYSVGLGNIWRFPYLCYRNGGAVFLVPYLLFLFLCAMPLFFAEVAIGQFSSLGPIQVWSISPLFKGIGYGTVILSSISCIYYNVIIAWAFFYLFKSFYSVLPWSTCGNVWNTDACTTGDRKTDQLHLNASLFNQSELEKGYNLTNASIPLRSSSEEFWEREVLQISSGIGEVDGVRWELFGCLALAWFIVFICLSKGIKSSGKAVYFTATFPYLVLIILLIRGVTLPGSMTGIKFYVIPRWHKLLELQVWLEAAMQIFYSAGPVWGALITMASYNKFNNDCYRDARIVPIMNSSTSIFSGFVIFSILGFMAHETGSSIKDVITQGPGLVFVVYPEATSRLPFGQFWSILFFLMFVTVGTGTMITTFQTVTSVFADEFEFVRKRRALVTSLLCTIMLLLGISCVTRGGVYVLQIMDWYCAVFSLFILAFLELFVIGRMYGVERFYKDIDLMIGYRPCIWWKILWCYLTPSIIIFMLLFSLLNHTPVTYGNYSYPMWAIGIGWFIAVVSLVPMPVIMVKLLLTTPGTMLQRLQASIKPSPSWGPNLIENRRRYIASLYGSTTEDISIGENLMDPKKHNADIHLKSKMISNGI